MTNDPTGNRPQYSPPAGQVNLYGQPYPQYQPARKGKLWLWLLIGGVALLVGGCVTAAVAVSFVTDVNSKHRSSSAATNPGIGQEAREGNVGFTVTDVSTAPTAGSVNAKGEFVIVSLTVKNFGNGPYTFLEYDLRLIDSSGKKFALDDAAEVSINDSIVPTLNPGNSIDLKLPFDLAVGAKPATLELHESIFSEGVHIKLN